MTRKSISTFPVRTLAALIIAAACTSIHAAEPKAASVHEGPDYVFYFIGDGMGMGPVMSTMNYLRLVHPNAPSLNMTTFPVVGWTQTWSASTPITDSAAAGTALSTGHKTRNSMLGMDADTVAVTSVARHLFDAGWGVGLVTSVAPDDATPAAFYAHVPKRSMYPEIDLQAIASGYHYLGGSALRGRDKIAEKIDSAATAEGIHIVYGIPGLAEASNSRAKRIIALGDSATMPHNNDISYTIDSVPDALTLPLLTQSCMDHLIKVSPDHFFMMVEGGNIDHALHANDGAAAIKEIINFDQAIGIALKFYNEHPDRTLIIVTADHDTGGMSQGNASVGYKGRPEYVDHARQSKEAFSTYCISILDSRRNYTWDDMRQYLADTFGFWNAVPLSDSTTEHLRQEFDNTFVNRAGRDEKSLYASFNAFAVAVYRAFNDAAGYGFTTTSHTGNPVPVFAIGVGADRLKGLNNNTDIPAIILDETLHQDLLAK